MKSATIRSFLLALLACVLMISMLASCGGDGGDETTGGGDVATTGPSDPGVLDPGDEDCEHTYTTEVVEPTCMEGGYTVYTCSKCGGSYKGNETAALDGSDHQWYLDQIIAPGISDGTAVYYCLDCCDCDDEELEEGAHERHNSPYRFTSEGYNATLDTKATTTTTGMIVKSLGSARYAVVGFKHKTTPTEVLSISPRVIVNGIVGTIVEIADGAFEGDSKITEVHIPSTVTKIGSRAFFGCTALKSVSVAPASELITIGDQAFSTCLGLTEFAIPNSVESIGSQVFYGSTSLNVTNTVYGALKEIGYMAFSQTATSSFAFGEYLDSSAIGAQAFAACESLRNVVFAEDCGLEALPAGIFQDCTGLTSVALPDSIKTISASAFNGCTYLRSVTFGEGSGLTEIATMAFSGTEALTAITLPDSLTKIQNKAFYMSGLKNLVVPANVEMIGEEAFYRNQNLETFTFAEGSKLNDLGEGVFHFCTALKKVDFPAGVTKVPAYLFSSCSALEEVSFAASIEEIGESAFFKASALTAFDFDDTILSIGDDAFQRSGITAVTFGANAVLTSIGVNAFFECDALTTVSLPATLTTLSKGAFYGCGVLSSFTFGAGGSAELYIGQKVFFDCGNLTTLTLPANLKKVNYYAFNNSKVEESAMAQISAMGGVEIENAPAAE